MNTSRAMAFAAILLASVGMMGCSGTPGPDTLPTSSSNGPETPTITTSSAGSSPDAGGTTTSGATTGRHVTVNSQSAFLTPSGNIACLFSGAKGAAQPKQVECQIIEKSFTGVKPTSCTDPNWKPETWSDSDIVLEGARKAQFACWVSQGLAPAADLAAPGAPARTATAWWDPTDPTVAAGSVKRAALSYGSSMGWGAVRCTLTQSGVTCTNSNSKHGFTLSKEAFTLS